MNRIISAGMILCLSLGCGKRLTLCDRCEGVAEALRKAPADRLAVDLADLDRHVKDQVKAAEGRAYYHKMVGESPVDTSYPPECDCKCHEVVRQAGGGR